MSHTSNFTTAKLINFTHSFLTRPFSLRRVFGREGFNEAVIFNDNLSSRISSTEFGWSLNRTTLSIPHNLVLFGWSLNRHTLPTSSHLIRYGWSLDIPYRYLAHSVRSGWSLNWHTLLIPHNLVRSVRSFNRHTLPMPHNLGFIKTKPKPRKKFISNDRPPI